MDEFWHYFTPATGYEKECYMVSVRLAQKLIGDMYYEARVRCVINWYAIVKKISLPKPEAKLRLMTREQYNKVPPQWCTAKKKCYQMIVDWWVCPLYVEKHIEAHNRRALIGGVHRQGSLSLGVLVERKRKETGQEVTDFEVLCATRQKKVVKEGESKWLNKSFERKQGKYCDKFAEVHGKDADPYKAPIDPEVAMLAGEGLKNGRLFLGDGSVDTSNTPSLSELRATRTSGKPAIEKREKPSLVMLSELQAKWEEETRKRVEAEREAAEMKAKMDACYARFASYDDMFAMMRAAGVPGIVSAPILPPLPPCPSVMPSAGSHNPEHVMDGSPVTPASTSMPPQPSQPPPGINNIKRRIC